jgi:hypothetical protein
MAAFPGRSCVLLTEVIDNEPPLIGIGLANFPNS